MGASRTTKPLTAHPAFPVIVALWFAALLGLGTFVVPPANFEGLVVGTGLDQWLPAAAPPLGDTAQLAISTLAALLGALLGLAIAARIRRVQDEPQTRSAAAEPATDSPWLADDDDTAVLETTEEAPAGDPEPDTRADSPVPGTVPTRLAGRRSTSERDYPLPGEEFEEQPEPESEEQPRRIFQASELSLGEVAEEQAVSSAEAETEEAETPLEGEPLSSEEDDDLQRFAADRLVAGLPRVQRSNFDDDPLEDWSSPESVADEPEVGPDFAAISESLATQAPDDRTREPDFDEPQLVEEAEYEELPGEPEPDFDQEVSPAESSEAADVEVEAGPETAPPDFSQFSLSELVARFDAALAAHRSQAFSDLADAAETPPGPSASEPSDDPVIAFLRREAERDRGAPREPRHERAYDPRAGLRNALDKLDRVSRKS